jgi:outer membrane protein, heavy metal efflux system
MRLRVLPFICLVGCLLGGRVAAQPGEIPLRLSLADAVRFAVERSPSLDVVRQQAAAADTDIAAARRWANPVASVMSEGYNGEPSGAGFFNQQELSMQVEQEFDLGGRRRQRTAVATAAAAAARLSVDERVRQLRIEVQQAYFQLVLARLDADLARASLDEVDKVIAVNRSRYQQGEVSGSELRRLEVERLRFSGDALQAELATRNSRSELLALMGASRLDLAIEPTDGLAPPPVPGGPGDAAAPSAAADPDALVARALAARPDVAAARQDRARAEAEAGLQRALKTPNLSVAGGVKRDFGANGLVWGVAIPLPLFDRNAPGIARADAERRAADSRARVIELAVSLEVQQALNVLDISRQRVAALEHDYLAKAHDARDGVLAAYRAGESDLLDYLDAQRVYRDVQRAYNRALLDYRLSLFQLDAAIGARPGDLLP